MGSNRKHSPLVLHAWQRAITFAFGALFLIAAAWYGLRDHPMFVAANGCTDAPVGCAVQVSAQPDAALIIALVVIAAIWLLIAVSGRVPGFDIAGLGMHMLAVQTEVGFVSPGELPQQSESATLTDADEHVIAAGPGGLEPRDIYLSLPLDVRLGADSTWSSTFPRSLLTEAAKEVRSSRVDGSDAWSIGAVSPLGEELWLRVIRRE